MRNLTKSIVIVTALSTLALAVPTAKEKFSKADINNDGILTSQEFYNDQARKMEQKTNEGKALKGVSTAPQFGMVDKNKDGKVTFSEYNKFHKVRQQQMKEIRNKGQNYSQGKGQGLDAFNRYDRNQDGVIDKNEFRPLYNNLNRNQNKGQGQGKGQGGGYGR